jgi:hypothetical protein
MEEKKIESKVVVVKAGNKKTSIRIDLDAADIKKDGKWEPATSFGKAILADVKVEGVEVNKKKREREKKQELLERKSRKGQQRRKKCLSFFPLFFFIFHFFEFCLS